MGLLDRVRRKGKPASAAEMDDLVLRQLFGRGADLSRPREVLHFLYFDSEESARAAADAVVAAGYEAAVAPPDEGRAQWSLRATGIRVTDWTTVGGFRALFDQLASEHGGEYDGWEAAAKP